MKNVLIIKHSDAPVTEAIESIMMSGGAVVRTVNPVEGNYIPENVRLFDGIVVTDGPMDTDDERYSFLNKEKIFLKKALEADMPMIGFSLGARLIAQVCGGDIVKTESERPEWKRVALTAGGRRDIIFYGLPRSMWFPMPVSEVYEIPDGASLLATSREVPHQAFRYRNAYGLQFAVESNNGHAAEVPKEALDEALNGACGVSDDLYGKLRAICLNFLWLADMRAKAFDTEFGSEQWLIGQAEVNHWKIA